MVDDVSPTVYGVPAVLLIERLQAVIGEQAVYCQALLLRVRTLEAALKAALERTVASTLPERT